MNVTSDVLLTERIGNVLVLTLNRPEVRNALNPELKDHLIQAARDADADPDIRAVVITGNGPVFCAGMDLKAFAKGGDFGGLDWLYKEGISKPVIGALNGPALAGGFELALACDLIIASEESKVGLPEVKRGLFAAGGGTTLSARIPLAVALEVVPAEETAAVFRSADAMEGARAFAERRPPVWIGK
jgi:enoyl-CoA hydratase/carnithine racemase